MNTIIKYAAIAFLAATVSASATELPESMKTGEDLAMFAQSLERDIAGLHEKIAIGNIEIGRARVEIEQLKGELAKAQAQAMKTPPAAPAPAPAATPAPLSTPSPSP